MLMEGTLPNLGASLFGPSLPVAVGAAVPVLVVFPITGYVRRRRGYAAMIVGIFAGWLLTLVYRVIGTLFIGDSSPSKLLEPDILVLLGVPFAFVWSSSIFFPELFRGRVSWPGVLVWAGLQAMIFALGPFVS